MRLTWINRFLATGIAAISLWVSASAFAGDSPQRHSSDQILDARWSLNPAGQLELTFDPLHNGQSEYGETYTVILIDRAPKMCGDPDGTGRHTWFFTDALMIEVQPLRGRKLGDSPQTPAQTEAP